jgi:hypothetical protein
MTATVQRRWVLALSTVSCLLAARASLADEAPPKASAEGKVSVDTKAEGKVEIDAEPEAEDAEAEPQPDEGGEPKEGEKKREKHEKIFDLGLDMVLGWGNVPFALQNPVGFGMSPQTPTFSSQPKVSSNVQSFIASGGAEVAEHVGVGVRVPITFATFNPNGAPSRSTAGVGNVELEGEYGGPIAHGLRLVGTLGLALPTATGDEIPDGLTNAPAGSVNVSSFDKYSMAKAAAFARGFEDNALFDPNRFGVIPKVSLLYRTHGLSIEPYLKIENLTGTSSNLAYGYVGELVGALRVGYWIHKEFELAVRGWFNTGFAGAPDDKVTSAAVEPQIVLRFGPVRPYAGLIVPFAGPPNDNGFIGARIGVSAGF